MGYPNGKTEAWYVLSATPEARVALGLKAECDALQFRASIKDGSVEDLVQWRTVTEGDVVLVPAGTVHAIGAGLVIAEVQQNSDMTFRLLDYGRGRPLDVERAVAVAIPGPAKAQKRTPRNLARLPSGTQVQGTHRYQGGASLLSPRHVRSFCSHFGWKIGA